MCSEEGRVMSLLNENASYASLSSTFMRLEVDGVFDY